MRRRILFILALPMMLAAAVWAASPALATSAHLKGNHPLSFTDNGLTLTATASYAGLGNFDTEQQLVATAQPIATCTSPGGGSQAPGQNPPEIDVQGTTLVKASDVKNGNVTISTTTTAPNTNVAGAPGCPNPNWTETITDLQFKTATITVFQDSNGDGIFESNELVLTVNVTFSPPTSDGAVPESGFTFTSA